MQTKLIGLLGGTSWPSTIEYYRIFNELTQEKLGGFHSANLLLRRIDYQDIKSRYYQRWDEIPSILEQQIKALVNLKPDCLIICNNTLHKAFDAVEDKLELSIPVFHIVSVTGREAQANNLNLLLLLGTQFTMEDGFYQQGLADYGMTVVTPDESERITIQQIQSQLAKGIMKDESRDFFIELVERYAAKVDAVVLACTELPLAFTQQDSKLCILNPTELQCKEAIEFSIKGELPVNFS